MRDIKIFILDAVIRFRSWVHKVANLCSRRKWQKQLTAFYRENNLKYLTEKIKREFGEPVPPAEYIEYKWPGIPIRKKTVVQDLTTKSSE